MDLFVIAAVSSMALPGYDGERVLWDRDGTRSASLTARVCQVRELVILRFRAPRVPWIVDGSESVPTTESCTAQGFDGESENNPRPAATLRRSHWPLPLSYWERGVANADPPSTPPGGDDFELDWICRG